MPVKKLYLAPIISDDELNKKEGLFIPMSYYQHIINDDIDVYCKDTGNLLLKFRKSVFGLPMCCNAYKALVQQAQRPNRNRGAAAGRVRLSSLPKYAKNVSKMDTFRVFYKDSRGKTMKDNIGNMSMSNIVGYYDRPDRNLYKTHKVSEVPLCRETAFTRDKVEEWKQCIPLIKAASQQFKKLVPDRFREQLERARKTPKYIIKDTAFSTVTINYNNRTACHKDKGDYLDGFGNLVVLERDKCEPDDNSEPYQGGYLGFPKYGCAVNVRTGDFLAMDVHQWHCNTELIGDKNKYGRLSLVLYLREKMIQCK